MSKKKWASCGCCIDWKYEFNERAKGSQYRFGDDDDAPYKRRKKKKKEKKNYWFSGCSHVYVWVKEIRPNRKWVPSTNSPFGWGKWVEIPGKPDVTYRHRCIGCGLIKRHSWSYEPPECDVYQTIYLDAYGNPL